MKIAKNGYTELLLQVQKVISQTQKDVMQTVNRAKVVMAWQIGQEIELHLKNNAKLDDKNYSREIFALLEKDSGVKQRALYQMRSFYKSYPTLPENENDLSWSHYRELATVKGSERRAILERLTVKNNLSAENLREEISQKKSRTKIKQDSRDKIKSKLTKFKVTRGQLFTYKIAKLQDSSAALIDLGFNIFTDTKTRFSDGEIVETKKKGEKILLKKSNLKPKSLHTYKAYLERVVDGDTIHVILDLGFKIKHREILRLAQINAAESNTTEGKKATAALQEILKDVPFLIVKTNKTDIYGRYIADVFLDENKKEINPQKVASSGVYLSQMLLDQGLVEVF